MMKAFDIEGLDLDAGTVIVNLERSVVCPVVNALRNAEGRHNPQYPLTYVSSLAHHLRSASKVLYGEKGQPRFGFQDFEILEVDVQQGFARVEIEKTNLFMIAQSLRNAVRSERNNIHEALWALGAALFSAARVLSGEESISNTTFTVMEDDV